MTFTTEIRLPRQRPVRPPLAHMRRAVPVMLELLASAIIIVLSLSNGAVTACLTKHFVTALAVST